MNERRKFLNTLGRLALLSGLAGVSGALLFRDAGGDDSACDFDFLCARCRKKSSCKLPEAEEYKKNNPDSAG